MRKYLIAGLLVWMPLGVTFLVVRAIVGFLDKSLLLLPDAFQPDRLLGFHIPGLGVLLAVALVLITGMIMANLLGRRLVAFWESLLARIPLVRTLYSAVKQIMEAVLATDAKSFRKVLLVEYPRKGVWSLAFMTSDDLGEVQDKTIANVISVFIPTTPNPTSGFVLMVPESDVIELDMAVEEGLKMIISMGVVVPNSLAYQKKRQDQQLTE
ncbi:hypothetical protein C9933_00485 [Methylophaga nitratireducenticrescens]|jgi:uncharacterized membrane protein|uniref:DUF502 domain-containing protein n=1 Tax=Pseudidiomarina aestuarii TaxID=624146 RepID=A0A2T4CWW6_9GAMM|nr:MULTISPECIES: DUF502 domain-containing protein [unclassified Methylophaga]PTB82851.1 hypothetical protein C9933_00485 [Methylophaga nitratireducenticrescens]PTB86018.1 hypothetical protein C9940_04105 [Pseudidiomarina aestuarii]MAL50161.1 hypothetical protein [Methylophaga sp.]MAP26716.1 hypothetical protein [Methylophaga sp.]MBP23929.1 hypothetical protein [Methylophaga sp.]|tara:strand:- start:75 stop:707 length:633 start_codon:yes stop_codon:yes gene_type:complete